MLSNWRLYRSGAKQRMAFLPAWVCTTCLQYQCGVNSAAGRPGSQPPLWIWGEQHSPRKVSERRGPTRVHCYCHCHCHGRCGPLTRRWGRELCLLEVLGCSGWIVSCHTAPAEAVLPVRAGPDEEQQLLIDSEGREVSTGCVDKRISECLKAL